MNALTPWKARLSPWGEIDTLQDRMHQLFGRSFPAFQSEEAMDWCPAVDLKETDGEYVLTAELAGMAPEDIDVEVEDNILILKGEKKASREAREGRWHLTERSHGTFERSFTLPRSIEEGDIEAEFDNGVLAVRLPKRQEAKGRRIDIAKK